MRRIVAVLLLLLAPPLPADAHHEPAQREDRSGAGWPIETLELVDHRGVQFDERRLNGRWTFMLFGDTRCEAPCKEALAAMVGVFQRIARTEAVKRTQLVFVTLDPARDTPAAVARYLQPYEAAAMPPRGESPPAQSRFVGLTGDAAGVRQLADELKAIDENAAPDAPVRYRGSLLLIGPDRMQRTEFLPPFDVPRLTAAFLLTRARR